LPVALVVSKKKTTQAITVKTKEIIHLFEKNFVLIVIFYTNNPLEILFHCQKRRSFLYSNKIEKITNAHKIKRRRTERFAFFTETTISRKTPIR